ncbi:MAG: DUF3553 domain-containing protein [Desulfofustis sp.]|nr:DUF3553 domain-containing protein [Desulfofustis sp.]MBT8360299.1 DUF3553 domain-containing protein [Deltaproteobacteria bacterium]NNF46871.1 DUF3553 domain-containing protein [Desulfofustis sp.]
MKVLVTNLRKGESVRHKARAEWGLGKIISVDTCGTIRVIFEGNKELSIAQGGKYLERVT